MSQLIRFNGTAVELHDPLAMPDATSFLWNKSTLLQMNCRGFASAQFMQPEPATYASSPVLEQTTFMQPERRYFANHPGRFFYLRNNTSGALYSLPFAPVNKSFDSFRFTASDGEIQWDIELEGLACRLTVSLDAEQPIEYWNLRLVNERENEQTWTLFPYFPFGYRSWMYQRGQYHPQLNAIISHSITPYQKSADYWKQKDFADLSFLKAEQAPDAWETRQSAFEGLGSLQQPDGIRTGLQNGSANYETPAAAMQYALKLSAGQRKEMNFAFGAAKQVLDISRIDFSNANKRLPRHYANLSISTPCREFDHFFNHWLLRQVQYHEDLHRLSTDPQTRNYLQDALGLSWIDPHQARANFCYALSRQLDDGSMPDGILLNKDAQLKYINLVPHTDHAVWLPICISGYIRASGDFVFLNERIQSGTASEALSVHDCVMRAFEFLLSKRDARGLCLIGQGDWCDPMNMVGIKGIGVSTWLTEAVAFAAKEWANICTSAKLSESANALFQINAELNAAINKHCWVSDRYARGITDNGRLFGIGEDQEGAIFLNAQSWAILSGATDHDRATALISLINQDLQQDAGVAMLNPPFTQMDPSIGRVTQKFPGTAENGSIYNHAAAFYAYALFTCGKSEQGFDVLSKMIPGKDDHDLKMRGQLPVFIPNYYRGANALYPQEAGRSSQLINTGTCHWVVRCMVEQLFGVSTTPEGVQFKPRLPESWPKANIKLTLKDHQIDLEIMRTDEAKPTRLLLNDHPVDDLVVPFSQLTKNNNVQIFVQ